MRVGEQYYQIKLKFLNWFYDKFLNPYHIAPYGMCPVQADGELPSGECYYFRSRGDSWSLTIAKTEKDLFTENKLYYYKEFFGEWPEAGYIDKYLAIKFATREIKKYYR